jgi:GNAT superfamily N-acetyltransferase
VPQPDHGPSLLTVKDVLQFGLPFTFVGRAHPARDLTAGAERRRYDQSMDVGGLAIEPVTDVALDELVALYDAVGWSAYTREPALLHAAIVGSSFVVVARRGGRVVGLARAVSDDATICYLQDVLVLPDEQRNGIGRALVEAVLARYRTVRQKVLLTDDEAGQRAFYESLGYAEIRDQPPGTLRAFVRFDG